MERRLMAPKFPFRVIRDHPVLRGVERWYPGVWPMVGETGNRKPFFPEVIELESSRTTSITGSPTFVKHPPNLSVLEKDGTGNDLMYCTGEGAMSAGVQSASFWMHIVTTNSGLVYLFERWGAVAASEWRIGLTGTTKFRWQLNDGTSTNTTDSGTDKYVAGKDYHVALVHDDASDTTVLYLNGVLVQTSASDTVSPAAAGTSVTNATCGGRVVSGTGPTVRTWNYRWSVEQWTTAEIREQYRYPFAGIESYPRRTYSFPPPLGMKMLQGARVGSDLYNGMLQ